MPKGGSKPGERRGGPQKGTPNKLTTNVKLSLLNTYAAIGGDNQFATWAKDNQTEFYKLYAKLLPTEIKNADGQAFMVALAEKIVSADANSNQDDQPAPDPE